MNLQRGRSRLADNFADELMKYLNEYTNEVSEQISSAADRLSKQARKELKSASPVRTGKYSKSWRLKRFGGGRRFHIVLYNNEYRLTHLLENGFTHKPDMAKIKARQHIDPVQERLNSDFEKECEKIIKGGI